MTCIVILSLIAILQISTLAFKKSFHYNKHYHINNHKKMSLFNHNNNHNNYEIQPKSTFISTKSQVNQLFNILSITSQVSLLSLLTPKNVKAIGKCYFSLYIVIL